VDDNGEGKDRNFRHYGVMRGGGRDAGRFVACAGITCVRPKSGGMARDLSTILRLRARARRGDRAHCSSCDRTPLAGELMHELESHRVVCQLCLSALPEAKRATIGSERVHVSERPLAVRAAQAA
jgi:hypothetical protein